MRRTTTLRRPRPRPADRGLHALRPPHDSTSPAAFAALFGPTVVELADQVGLTSLSSAIYATLAPTQKESVIQQRVNACTRALGYDALGLEDLGACAALLQGGSIATSTFGWTEFEIDPPTRKLQVTTYGVDAGACASINKDPAAFAALRTAVVSRFEVTPVPEPRMTLLLAAGLGCLLWAARSRRRAGLPRIIGP